MSKGLRVCLEALVRSRDASLIITLRIQFKEPHPREWEGEKIQFHSRHFLRKPSRVFQPAQVPTGHSTKYHLILIPLNFNAWKCDLGLSGAGGVTLGRMNIQTVACRATASGVLLESKGFVCFFLLSCLFKRALSSTLEMRKVLFCYIYLLPLAAPQLSASAPQTRPKSWKLKRSIGF